MGEGFLALSVALSFGHFDNPWAWTYMVFVVSMFTWRQVEDDRACAYMVFVVSMFTWRQIEDDRACAEKYGAEKWAEYQARVKYRIMPGVY